MLLVRDWTRWGIESGECFIDKASSKHGNAHHHGWQCRRGLPASLSVFLTSALKYHTIKRVLNVDELMTHWIRKGMQALLARPERLAGFSPSFRWGKLLFWSQPAFFSLKYLDSSVIFSFFLLDAFFGGYRQNASFSVLRQNPLGQSKIATWNQSHSCHLIDH